jgi:hypothetical protein
MLRRTVMRRTVLRTVLRMRLALPLGTWIAALRGRRTSLRARSLRTYVWTWILRVVASRRALGRSIIAYCVWVRARRVVIPSSASTSATASRTLMLRIPVLRILLGVVQRGRAGRRWRRGRRELVLLVRRHVPSTLHGWPARVRSTGLVIVLLIWLLL